MLFETVKVKICLNQCNILQLVSCVSIFHTRADNYDEYLDI